MDDSRPHAMATPRKSPPRGAEHGNSKHAPQRLAFALSLFQPEDGDATPLHYTRAQAAIMKKFAVCRDTARLDIKRAYDEIAKLNAEYLPTLAPRVREGLERNALKAEAAGDRATAISGWRALGKVLGMEESEDSLVKKLSDAALEAAIKQAVAEKIEGMSDAEFADLQQRRAAKAGGQ